MTRNGFLARVRVEDYGPGRIRPHERTHPGPKEDRLRLTRATRTNCRRSSASSRTPTGRPEPRSARRRRRAVRGRQRSRGHPQHALAGGGARRDRELQTDSLAGSELLIADGHHRYETARVYADEIGGEGEHRYVLMLLCSLSDPGLTVFPTHRLLTGLKDDSAKQQAIRETLMRDFDIEELPAAAELEPSEGSPVGVRVHGQLPPQALPGEAQGPGDRRPCPRGMPEPYRRLDTAVLEALVLRGALGMSEDDISHLHGLDYSKNLDDAIEAVETGRADAGFFMRATPVEQVREVAEAGESMPPKSTYFFPKVPTGLVFSPLAVAVAAVVANAICLANPRGSVREVCVPTRGGLEQHLHGADPPDAGPRPGAGSADRARSGAGPGGEGPGRYRRTRLPAPFRGRRGIGKSSLLAAAARVAAGPWSTA